MLNYDSIDLKSVIINPNVVFSCQRYNLINIYVRMNIYCQIATNFSDK